MPVLNTPSDDEVGDEVAPAFAAPRGVERHGIDPIPEQERTTNGWDLFQILINVMLNPGLILIGGMAVVAGLSFWAAVTTQLLGIATAFVAYTTMATVGVDYGLPGIVATRAFLGVNTSRWIVSGIRAASAAVWFAFQTLAGAMGIVAVLQHLFGISPSVVLVSVLFGIFQVAVALFGYQSVTWLSRVAFPVKVIILGYLLFVMTTHGSPAFAPSKVFSWQGTAGWEWKVLMVWITTVAVGWFSQVTDAADYCRYCSSRRQMWAATIAAALVGTFFSAFFGAYAAVGSGAREANAFAVIPGLHVGVFTLLLVLIVLILDNWTINVLNIYTGGLALANLAVKLGRFWSTMIVAVVGIVLAALPQVAADFSALASDIGSFFAPLVGVIVADYLVIKRGHINVPALYQEYGPYRYRGGFNVVALVWIAIGTVAYFIIPITVLPILTTTIGAGLGYALTIRFLGNMGPKKVGSNLAIGGLTEDGTQPIAVRD